MIAEFAQIVGLLAAFQSGRQNKQSAELQEFLGWLTEHNHENIRNSIEQHQKTATSIKALLSLRLDDIDQKLDIISKQLAEIAHRTEGVENLASSYSESLISEQAFDILRNLNQAKDGYFLIGRSMNSPTTLVVGGGPNYDVKEPRFLEDDLNILTQLGLLLLECTSKGEPRYRITRAASMLFPANI